MTLKGTALSVLLRGTSHSLLSVVLISALILANPLTLANAVAVSGQQDSRGSWSNVQAILTGIDLVVSVRGSQAVKRVFLSADTSSLFVLNLAGITLAPSAERSLRDLVTSYSTQLIAGEPGEIVNGDVRVGRAGLFVMEQKVAELSQVIQRVDRGDVLEVRLASPVRHHPILRATAIGAVVGAGVGLGLALSVVRCGACVENWTGALLLLGLGIGAAVGESVGAARSKRSDQGIDIIYAAP